VTGVGERSGGESAPDLGEVLADLRTLRLEGLTRLRRLRLPALGRAAGGTAERAAEPAAIEEVLSAALRGLDSGNLARAAAYTFGLEQGTRDWPAQTRRRRAAEVYGVSVERFRKHQEVVLLEEFAEQILRYAAGRRDAPENPRGSPDARTLADPRAPADPPGADAGSAAAEATALRDVPVRGPVPGPGESVPLTWSSAPGAVEVPIRFDLSPVELLRDIDILVSPTNVYLEPSRMFAHTVSAALRRAAARRDESGHVVDDVVQRELAAWVRRYSGGGALPPGTAVPTAPGALSERGVRRIYHVAVASPAGGGEGAETYTVDEQAIFSAVHHVMELARRERGRFDPPLASVCFPLIGAGRAGGSAEVSIRVLWWALQEELARDPHWRIHIASRQYEPAGRLLEHLLAQGGRRE
jgi:O-acetyl-ADP-ribose deacetylase (regulator of RNase III)